MKFIRTTYLFLLLTIIGLSQAEAQSFFDDFESYKPGNYLGNSSSVWTTWNSSPGTSEDTKIDTNRAYSGKNSIYFNSPYGNGPQDVVLPFGGKHTTGHFRLTSRWYIPSKSGAYFNFQGGASIGNSWAMDVYMYDDATIDVGGYLYGNYPQDQWFELVVDVDLDQDRWEVFIDGSSLGYYSNPTNSLSYMDIYGLFTGEFWVDDVGYCLNNACLPDLQFEQLTVNPNPLCSNHYADIVLKLKNNGPDLAKSFDLGVQMDGQSMKVKKIDLGLAKGQDTTITVSNLFKTNITGSNLRVRAINVGGDRNTSNDTADYKVNVVASPSGFALNSGSPFQGYLNYNNVEDLLEVKKKNVYSISPPTGYSNSGFPTTWTFNTINIRTSGGVTLPGTAYQFTTPSGSNNATISIIGDTTYLDSLLLINIGIKNNTTGCDSIVTRYLRIVPTPKLGINFPSSICTGDNVNFTNKSSIHSGNVTFDWYFGDGDSSDVNDPIHQYLSPGTYNLTLIGTSHPYGIVVDTTIVIQVNEIPEAKFTVRNKCEGQSLDFTNLSAVANGTMTYEWDFGDGSAKSSQKDPKHKYVNVGTYTATLKVSSNGCVSTYQRQAITFPTPVAGFTAPNGPICAKTEVILPNTSTLLFGKIGYYWKYGDGNVSTLESNNHAYDAAGNYTVQLIAVSEFDCRDTVSKLVTIKPAPVPSFTGDRFCQNDPTYFNNTTAELVANPIYTWTFSDNFTSNQKNISKTWAASGPVTAKLGVQFSNGCSAELEKNFDILIQPVAKFNVQDICSGKDAVFVNRSYGDKDGIVYTWDFGLGGTDNETNPVVNYSPSKSTTYTVALVAAYIDGCSDTSYKTLNVSESPVCDFTYKNLGLNGAQFTPGNTSYSQYEWFFGEGGTSTAVSPVYQYLYTGNFNVTMRATNAGGCTCETSKRISANTGIQDLENLYGVSVYPNPNNGQFYVSNAKSENMLVEVYDVLGNKISSQTSSETLYMDLGELNSGVYMVKVTINGQAQSFRITINQ